MVSAAANIKAACHRIRRRWAAMFILRQHQTTKIYHPANQQNWKNKQQSIGEIDTRRWRESANGAAVLTGGCSGCLRNAEWPASNYGTVPPKSYAASSLNSSKRRNIQSGAWEAADRRWASYVCLEFGGDGNDASSYPPRPSPAETSSVFGYTSRSVR